MRNTKVIQHINDMLQYKLRNRTNHRQVIQEKSLEFTHEFIGNFRRKDSLTFDSKQP